MAFQWPEPSTVYFDALGVTPLAGGSITFYDAGTTNLRNTWSREEQGSAYLNTNPIILDSSGRAPVEIWMDGAYSYVIKDSLGATVRSGDYGAGSSTNGLLPPLAPGFLTNDSISPYWEPIRQVPDPSGMNNRILSNDGANLLWVEQPEPPVVPDPDIVVTAVPLSFRAGIEGESDKFYMEAGTGSAPASGANTTQAIVSLATTFASTPVILLTPTVAQGGSSGYMPAYAVIAKSATSFTVKFDTNAGQDGGGRINNPISFDYMAIGIRIVADSE